MIYLHLILRFQLKTYCDLLRTATTTINYYIFYWTQLIYEFWKSVKVRVEWDGVYATGNYLKYYNALKIFITNNKYYYTYIFILWDN